MQYHKNKLFHTALILLLSTMAFAEQNKSGSVTIGADIKSAEQAVSTALAYTGFDKLANAKIADDPAQMAKMVTYRDSTTPFLADEMDGRRAWRIAFDGVILHRSSTTPETEALYPKDFEVFVDSATGQILQIVAFATTGIEDLKRDPTAAEAEEILSAFRKEKYLSLPEKGPALSLSETWRSCRLCVMNAKKIIISFVMYSSLDSDVTPVWVIYMRGLWPYTAMHGEEYKRTNLRCVIDANTGQMLLTTNVPYPELENDEIQKE